MRCGNALVPLMYTATAAAATTVAVLQNIQVQLFVSCQECLGGYFGRNHLKWCKVWLLFCKNNAKL